ncbi:FAD-dependent oxidoreductase [Iamia sp. SCSIO 61187]|uniref:FAD-dependent oxidoreductase n=1 Tax=Iamia sp. SCSIO 61187 TaxID=2722752 RepID=UPI001C62B6D3|nr:FAD-dependent oxidoreductase [Iamia sp. SCSIO 61187]QYG92290.1 FAD-dependent oxidoreductase [Iamia sp. SCSIO 61187]
MPDLPAAARPLWTAPDTARPPLDGDVEADVVVVGGGIAGLTAAVLLARGGARVRVLEAGTVGQGTTGASTAKVTALQSTRLSAIRRAHGDAAVAGYTEAQLAAQAWVVTRAEERDALVRLEIRDAVTYTTEAAHVDEVDAEADAARAAGLAVEVGDAVPELPFGVRRAVRLADQVQLDSRAWTIDLAAELDEAPGAHVHEQSRVTGIDPRGRHVTTDGGRVRADHIVLATLLPITDRGAFFAQVEPAMSHGIAVTLNEPVADGFPMAYGEDSTSRSLRTATTADGTPVLVVGGGGHTVGRKVDTLEEPEELLAWAHEHFAVAAVTHRWSAHDLRPIDQLPFAGRADRLPGSPWIMTGFAKWGMTNGTAAAMTVAGRILGEEPRPWDALFDPRRHRGLTGAKKAARLNAEVAREMALGWAHPSSSTTAGGPPVGRRRGVPCGAVRVDGDQGADGCAVSLVCTHLGGIVRWDEAAATWDCPLHGSRFDAEGVVVAGPAVRPLHRHEGEPDPTPDATVTR